jgi:murein DD-endopeptidase MepM/ murein hydrolase activator NlpD
MRSLVALIAVVAALAAPSAALADAATGGTTPGSGSSAAAGQSQGTSAGGSGSQSTTAAPASWTALGTAASRQLGRRELRPGMRGADVRVLQQLLVELKYRAPVSGIFEAVTLRAVKQFQRRSRLGADGRVGPRTVRALRGAHAALHATPATAQAPVSADGWAFPIRGAHDYGTSINRYGAARSGHTHQGQDVMANCGLPLVAARGGTVVAAGSGGAAGNYLAVHTTDTPYDYFYAHMRSTALVREGQTVTTGQPVGYVGETGDATACHLHFELWQGRWWAGGHTIDPLSYLKAWDAAS